MAVDATKMIVPGNGTLFHAPIGTALPTKPLEAFTLTGAPPADWTNLGHTSRENTVAFAREGGEATSLGTWLMDSTSTIYSAIAWSLAIPALQFDEDVLDFAFNGDFDQATGGYIVPGQTAAVKTQLFLLMQDGSGSKLGFWIPNSEVTLAEPPGVNREQYLELPLNASINGVASDVIPDVDGRAAIMELFKTGLVAPTGP